MTLEKLLIFYHGDLPNIQHKLSPTDMINTVIVSISLNLMNTWNYMTGGNTYTYPLIDGFFMSLHNNLLSQPTFLVPPDFYDNTNDYIRMIITVEITG
jgi:hypothetical protein